MATEENERKYNGWTNYETWVVKLWLDNEESSYRYWTGEARRWHGEDEAAQGLAAQLKDELSEASPVNEPTVYGDLMNAALEEVNWLEIAESYLEEVAEAPTLDDAQDEDQSTEAEESCDSPAKPEAISEEPNAEDIFGEVIFAYTRADALADGVLIDVTDTAKEAGFRIPVAVTAV